MSAGGPKGGNHAAVAVRDHIYLFGESGADGGDGNQIEVHILNTASLHWIKLPPVQQTVRGKRPFAVPPRCYDHTAVLIEDAIYIWGGYSCASHNLWQYSDVLYAFDIHTHKWTRPRVSGTPPMERRDHSACALGATMYVYGGYTQHRYTNVMYKLDTAAMVWSTIKTRGVPPPASLQGHTATVIGTHVFVFGGYGDNAYSNDIRVFDTETESWLSWTAPPHHAFPEGRWGHSAFAYNGELYVFGGCDPDQTFNDLWRFNPETFSWKRVEVKGKGPSRMYYMSCCMVGDRIVFFAGYKVSSQGYRSVPANNLFVLDLSPSLKTLCKLAVNRYNLKLSGLPLHIRSELVAMTKKTSGKHGAAKRDTHEILFARRQVMMLSHPTQESGWLKILKLKMGRKFGNYVDIGIHLEKAPL